VEACANVPRAARQRAAAEGARLGAELGCARVEARTQGRHVDALEGEGEGAGVVELRPQDGEVVELSEQLGEASQRRLPRAEERGRGGREQPSLVREPLGLLAPGVEPRRGVVGTEVAQEAARSPVAADERPARRVPAPFQLPALGPGLGDAEPGERRVKIPLFSIERDGGAADDDAAAFVGPVGSGRRERAQHLPGHGRVPRPRERASQVAQRSIGAGDSTPHAGAREPERRSGLLDARADRMDAFVQRRPRIEGLVLGGLELLVDDAPDRLVHRLPAFDSKRHAASSPELESRPGRCPCPAPPAVAYTPRVAILLSALNLTHAFGARALFEGVSFTLADGDRVGLIGPNGAGKSTLLRILVGELGADGGTVAARGGLRVAYLPQMPEFVAGATVREAIGAGLPTHGGSGATWEDEARVDEIIAKLGLAGAEAGADQGVERLSGGWRKRVALARALVGAPELLLLDEPTNHLDVESILWLEKFLAAARFATVTVTHDRLFLQRVGNRILELDRRNAGGLLDVAGDYATYVDRKADAMAAQERREDVLRNTLRRETEWLRRGPAARTTKQEARIQRAGALSEEVAELETRNRGRAVDLDFQASGRKTKRLIEARGISVRYGARAVFEGLDVLVGPGTRLGLLGPNGCGKSTLLRVLTGAQPPTTGQVTCVDGLEIAFFEQDRGALDPARSVADTVCPDGDFVQFRGARVHRHGYLERFLFRAEQMSQPVGRLSGGEQSRLLVAELMLRPASVLVLDEPTNDLDLPTLALLEDALTTFEGAVLLVTHDRYFLDQVATQILGFHVQPGEEGRVTSFAGLAQWEEWHRAQTARLPRGAPTPSRDKALAPAAPVPRKKLGFKDQREWDTIEGRITEAEARLAALEAELQRPEVATDAVRLVALDGEIAAARADVDRLYARWAELEALRSA
jgi:ATP-binding cassette subfamily F protein uup